VTATRVYVDTSVVVHFLHPASEHGHAKARAFFLDLERSAYQGVVSDFCRLEYCGYLKDEIATIKSGNVTKTDIDLWMGKFDSLLDDYGVEEISADALLSTPFVSDCREVIEKSTPVRDERDDWLVVKGADSVHAVLAARCEADFLATLDKGFRGLQDGVKPMVLWDTY